MYYEMMGEGIDEEIEYYNQQLTEVAKGLNIDTSQSQFLASSLEELDSFNAKYQAELTETKEAFDKEEEIFSQINNIDSSTNETTSATDKNVESVKELSQAFEAEEQSVKEAVANEQNVLNDLINTLNNVIVKVDEKTRAFQEEGQVVDGVILSEITNLETLSGNLILLRDNLKSVDLNVNLNGNSSDVTDFIKSLSKISDTKVTGKLDKIQTSLKQFVSSVNKIKINDNGILASLNGLLVKSKELENLATIIKTSKKKIEEAQKTVESKSSTVETSSVDEAVKQYNRLYDAQIKLSKIESGTKEPLAKYYTEEITKAQQAINNLTLTEEEAGTVAERVSKKQVDAATAIFESQRKQVEQQDKLNKSLEDYQSKVLKQATSLYSNGKLMSEYGDRVREIVDEINSLNTKVDPSGAKERLRQLENELTNISSAAKEAGKSGESFGQILVKRFKSLAAYLATFVQFYDIIRYVRTAFSTLVDLDTQLVDLRKTTSMTTSELNEFYGSASNVSKQLGVTTSEIISQAAAWSRLGYSSKEASTEMAKLSSQFASISPGMDTESATDTLVSTMQAYKIGVDDVQRTVMDNINAIGNSMATTNEEIGEMLQRSSAAMKAANNSLEETIALESAAVEITRNAETTGTAFRTISMRIRGYDEETEELSDDLKTISGDIYDLTKVNGKGISIFTDDTKTEYKSTYEILKEISGIWDELTDKQQADLLEKLGGKRGAQSLAGILADFSSVEEAMTTMENAAGSADREMGIIRDSLEFKINALKQTWVGVLTEVTNRSDIGNIIDGLTAVSDVFGGLISKIGLFKSVLTGVFTVIGSQKLGLFGQNSQGKFGLSTTGLGGIITSYKTLGADIQSLQETKQLINTWESNAEWDFSDTTGALKGLSDESRNCLNTWATQGATAEQMIGKIDERIYSLQTTGSKATGVISKLGATLLNGFVSLGISTAISLIIKGIENVIHSEENLMNEVNEVTAAYTESQTSLTNYGKKIEELKGIIDSEASTTEDVSTATTELYDIQKELIGTYGAYAEGLDLVNGELSEQLDLIEGIKEANIIETYNKIQGKKSWNEKVSEFFGWGEEYTNAEFNNARNIKYAMEHYGEDYNYITGDINKGKTIKGVSIDDDTKRYIDKLETITVQSDGSLLIGGYASQVKEDIELLQQYLSINDKMDTKVEKKLSNIYADVDNVIGEYGESYNAILDYEVLTDEKLNLYKEQIEEAATEYKKAYKSGEEELIKTTSEEYGKTFSNILTAIANDDSIDDTYIDYFNKLYPELQGLVSNWELTYKVVPDTESASEELQAFIKDHSTEEILAEYDKYTKFGQSYGNKEYLIYFQELETLAQDAKTNVDDLVESLHKTDEFHYASGKKALLYQPTQQSYTDVEDQKIDDWGLSQYKNDIQQGTIQTTYGNINMNNRDIIEWDDWNLARFKDSLETWGTLYDEHGNMVRSYYDDLKEAYDEGYKNIDTVYGTVDTFEYGEKEHDIAFTPILETENGAVFLSSDDVYKYLNQVISKAAEDGDLSAEHILEIDAEGVGFQVGNDYVKGIIGGIDSYTGSGGESIPAQTVGKLMHFSGSGGAYNIAKTDQGFGTITPNINQMKYNTLYGQGVSTLTDEQVAHNDLITNWYNKLSEESKAFFDSISSTLSEEELEVTFGFNNEFELDNWLYGLQQELNSSPLEIPLTVDQGIDKLDELEDKIDSLGDLWDNTVNKVDSSGNETSGVPSASDIADVNSSFGGVRDDDGNYTKMAGALMTFDETITQNIGNTEKQQDAYDSLITSSIVLDDTLSELTGDLENVTEAQKQEYIQMLKDQKITNAEEVVESRLNKTYVATRENIIALNSAINEHRDVLEQGASAGKDYEEAIESIKDEVNNLFGTYDENGNFTPADFDTDFIKEHFDDITEAANGSQQAINNVYAAYAKEGGEKILIEADLDTSEFEEAKSTLDYLIDEASKENITVDALLNNQEFMTALVAMLNSSKETANAITSALSNIGIDIKYKTTPRKITVPKAQAKTSTSIPTSEAAKGANGGSDIVYWTTEDITVDDISLVSTKTGASSGTKATYGGSGSSSSSSGSGGSGSDSSSDESENTFDWIEVAIERLESELTRLGEIADDVYEGWGKRNEALADSIKKTTDEIELQKNAAKRYLAEANSIGLSEDYKKKVQEGKLDIETITDEDLAEDINDYQTYWEAYQDAMDQVQTLTIAMQDLYKEIFENIESEYDDLITNIEKKTDIIEERITRTEEHGYFVDRKYYDEELKLEEENNERLLEERSKLINALNEAITKGMIKSGSEAWNDMYQSIMDVNKAIEESYTNTVKLNNAIRQLEWDAFDWIEDRISDISAEADFLIGLLQGELNYEDNGQFNNRGFAQAGLIGAKYDETLAKAQRYKKEILEINKDLADDPNDKNLIERKEELVQAYRDAISAAEDEKQAMKSLVEEAFNKNLESLQKLIDKYKEAMQSAKD